MAENNEKSSFSPEEAHLDEPRSLCVLFECGLIGGVCAGIAYRLGVSVWLIRAVWFVLAAFFFTAIVVYCLCLLLLPRRHDVPADYKTRARDNIG